MDILEVTIRSEFPGIVPIFRKLRPLPRRSMSLIVLAVPHLRLIILEQDSSELCHVHERHASGRIAHRPNSRLVFSKSFHFGFHYWPQLLFIPPVYNYHWFWELLFLVFYFVVIFFT